MLRLSHFSPADWKIFLGHSLLLVGILFYALWWITSFSISNWSGPFILLALAMGMTAMILLSSSLTPFFASEKVSWTVYVIAGFALISVALLFVTRYLWQRPVTSELLILLAWATVEVLVVLSLRVLGTFSRLQTALSLSQIFVASLVGLVCYVLYYRLEPNAQFWDGLIPLGVDALVVSVLVLLENPFFKWGP